MAELAYIHPDTVPAPVERSMMYGKRTTLVGVLTYASEPAAEDSAEVDRPCAVILNGGIIHKIGPGRLSVRLGRSLADAGFDVFRFDFAGVGDSPNRTDGQSLADGVITDVEETLDHLQAVLGYRRFVLMGLCSGADNGMRAAEHDPRVVGVVMLDPTIDRTPRWYWERFYGWLSSWTFWKSMILFGHPKYRKLWDRLRGNEVEAQGSKPELYQVAYSDREDIKQCLSDLLDRNVQLFVVISGTWSFIYNYEKQFYDVYPELDFGDRLALFYRPGADHMYYDSEQRLWLMETVTQWMRSRFC